MCTSLTLTADGKFRTEGHVLIPPPLSLEDCLRDATTHHVDIEMEVPPPTCQPQHGVLDVQNVPYNEHGPGRLSRNRLRLEFTTSS